MTTQPVHGECDVVIFHPRHDLTLARLPHDDLLRIIDEWVRIYTTRGRQLGIDYVQIFEVRSLPKLLASAILHNS